MPRLFDHALPLLAALSALSSVNAQCANNVAVYNPDLRTLTANATWFIVPVPKAAALTAVKEAYPLLDLTLLDIPTSDHSLFPHGFPSGMQPALTSIGLTDDIRMSALQIDGGLKIGQVYIGYVGQGDSKSPLQAQVSGYIAGENGPLPNGLVPAVATTLLFGGNPTRLGQFNPTAPAYAAEGNDVLFTQAKWAVLPNPLSGPGAYPEAFDFEFRTVGQSKQYTDKTFKWLINLPTVLPTGQCQRNAYYFNNATAMPVFRNGNVTFGPGADGISLTSSALMKASPGGVGVNPDVDGYSACAQGVGFSIQDCDEASKEVDPSTLD